MKRKIILAQVLHLIKHTFNFEYGILSYLQLTTH